MTSHTLRTLDGKVALVTGASSGIGRAAALELARRGDSSFVSGTGLLADGGYTAT